MTTEEETMYENVNRPYLSPVLLDLVKQVTYKPNWRLWIAYEVEPDGSGGWQFFIVSHTPDSYDFETTIRVRHGFLIPSASYNRDSWVVWLFERCLDVERHEAGEFFKVNGVREFAPHHGNGEDPYITWHMSDYDTALKRAGDD